jgi:ATP-dependent DNA ligase
LDGAIVVPAADGTTDYAVLIKELKGTSTKIALVAFDLLYLNGRGVRSWHIGAELPGVSMRMKGVCYSG